MSAIVVCAIAVVNSVVQLTGRPGEINDRWGMECDLGSIVDEAVCVRTRVIADCSPSVSLTLFAAEPEAAVRLRSCG